MLRLLSIGIDVAASSTVLLPAIAILRHTFYPENNRKKGVWAAVFALYLTAVFSATGLPSVNERTVDAAVNWIPLAAALGDPAGYAKNMIWNLIMFIPLGVLLPGLWTEFRCLRDVSFFGLGLSAAIELMQLFTFRTTDVDDLIANTAGAALGWLIAAAWAKRGRPGTEIANASPKGRSEPFVIGAIALGTAYFVQPFLAEGLWTILLR